MNLLILRHGAAEPFARRDSERELTPPGRDETLAVLNRQRDHLADVRRLLVSPYRRAQQTAQLAQQYLPDDVTRETTELLVPEAPVAALLQHLQMLSDPTVMLVSHQPLVGHLVDGLCGFETGRYCLGTSALAKVQAEILAADLGELEWLLQPSDLL